MEPKKNENLDLERKRPLFFFIGMVTAMSSVIVAFEWKSEFEPICVLRTYDIPDELYVPDITIHDKLEAPKPVEVEIPKPKVNQVAEVVESEEPSNEETVIDAEPVDIEIPFDFLGMEIPEEEPEYFEGPVESAPKFPGGMDAFYKYVSESMKYPSQARRMGVEGRVYVRFIVNLDGSITDVEVVKGVGYGCDAAAKIVLENAPKFIPAKQRGKAVRYRQVIPIFFMLE